MGWTRPGQACIADFKGAEDNLVAAFPRLQRLTSLRLKDTIASAAVLTHVSALRSLQQLEVVWTRAEYPVQLPQSLTRLYFAFATIFVTDPERAITTANAASLSRLTALQSLHLEGVRPLDTALLRSMTRLRELRLTDVEHVAGSQRLAVVSCFTALTALSIDGHKLSKFARDPATTITAAETAGLTASSHLVSLTISGGQKLAPCSWADVFPPCRQWHSLTQLTLSADFLRSPDTVQLVGRCAPNLQHVVFDKTQYYHQPPGDADQHARLARMGVGALEGWSRLRKLSLEDPWVIVPGGVWESLGYLSQITSLFMRLEQKPIAADVVCLEGCTGLQSLEIRCFCGGVTWDLNLRSTAAPGDPPNVWQRVPEEWQRVLEIGRWQYSLYSSDEFDAVTDAAFEEYGYADDHGNIFYH